MLVSVQLSQEHFEEIIQTLDCYSIHQLRHTTFQKGHKGECWAKFILAVVRICEIGPNASPGNKPNSPFHYLGCQSCKGKTAAWIRSLAPKLPNHACVWKGSQIFAKHFLQKTAFLANRNQVFPCWLKNTHSLRVGTWSMQMAVFSVHNQASAFQIAFWAASSENVLCLVPFSWKKTTCDVIHSNLCLPPPKRSPSWFDASLQVQDSKRPKPFGQNGLRYVKCLETRAQRTKCKFQLQDKTSEFSELHFTFSQHD